MRRKEPECLQVPPTRLHTVAFYGTLHNVPRTMIYVRSSAEYKGPVERRDEVVDTGAKAVTVAVQRRASNKVLANMMVEFPRVGRGWRRKSY